MLRIIFCRIVERNVVISPLPIKDDLCLIFLLINFRSNAQSDDGDTVIEELKARCDVQLAMFIDGEIYDHAGNQL